jgi:hypothetical protein
MEALMRATRAVVLSFVLLMLAAAAAAQSARMPLPGLKIVDADGKTVGEAVDIHCDTGNSDCWPVVVILVDGVPAFLHMRPFGLIDRVATQSPSQGTVFFSSDGCVGAAAVNQAGGLELLVARTHFGVAGPDPTLGIYKLYRSTSTTATTFAVESKWANGVCDSNPSGNSALFPAEEVIPNPLEGFHGPTVAEPDRTWSVQGGTTIVPPAPPTPTPPAPPTATPPPPPPPTATPPPPPP